jgi:transposase InsO family protein
MIKRMYINKNNKLSKSDRFKIVKHFHNGRYVTDIAKRFGISRTTVYNIIGKYRLVGSYGLQDHKPGRLRVALNPSFYANIVDLRKKNNWGACRIEKYFNRKGFSVSHNKINQVIQYEGLTRKKLGKKCKPSYVSYEVENINDQWHIDWSIDPLSKKYLLAIIDDKSRFIVYAGLFDRSTGENSAIGLQNAIDIYGAPKEIVSDNGSHFKKVKSIKTPCEPVKQVEEKYGIKHIFIRAYHPQSNGKIERWFGSYKGEFPKMNHPDVKDLITWVKYYNFERLHQSLDYETPAYVYLGVNSI